LLELFIAGADSLIGLVRIVVLALLVFEGEVRVGGIERIDSVFPLSFGTLPRIGSTRPPAVLTEPPLVGRGPLTMVFLLPPLEPPPYDPPP
jgi:hypothetical protein